MTDGTLQDSGPTPPLGAETRHLADSLGYVTLGTRLPTGLGGADLTEPTLRRSGLVVGAIASRIAFGAVSGSLIHRPRRRALPARVRISDRGIELLVPVGGRLVRGSPLERVARVGPAGLRRWFLPEGLRTQRGLWTRFLGLKAGRGPDQGGRPRERSGDFLSRR